MSREVRRRLTAEAETAAVTVFSDNLRGLLLQRPLRGAGPLLGIDPGFTSGCKLAVIGECGQVSAASHLPAVQHAVPIATASYCPDFRRCLNLHRCLRAAPFIHTRRAAIGSRRAQHYVPC